MSSGDKTPLLFNAVLYIIVLQGCLCEIWGFLQARTRTVSNQGREKFGIDESAVFANLQ